LASGDEKPPEWVVKISDLLLVFFLVGVGWYAVTFNPEKHRRRRVWLGGVCVLFVLYTIVLVLVTQPSNLVGVVFIAGLGLFLSAISVLVLWVPLVQRDWVRGWRNSQPSGKTKK